VKAARKKPRIGFLVTTTKGTTITTRSIATIAVTVSMQQDSSTFVPSVGGIAIWWGLTSLGTGTGTDARLVDLRIDDDSPLRSWGHRGEEVVPLAGAWIETFSLPAFSRPPFVAPIAGAWIETS